MRPSAELLEEAAYTSLLVFFITISALITHSTLPNLTGLLNATPKLTEFSRLLVAHTNYSDLLYRRNITILAPTDEAFANVKYSATLGLAFEQQDRNVMAAVLEYHILQGTYHSSHLNETSGFIPTELRDSKHTNVTSGQAVICTDSSSKLPLFTSGLEQQSTLNTTDLPFNYGIIHTLNTVLLPPLPLTATAPTYNLSAFLSAIAEASFTTYIDTATDLTIFAPNNAAFESLNNSNNTTTTTLSSILTSDLADLLNSHIIDGNTAGGFIGYSSNLVNGTVLQTNTKQGGNNNNNTVTITTKGDGSIFVNAAQVVQRDLLLSNGVMHIIDGTLDSSNSYYHSDDKVRNAAMLESSDTDSGRAGSSHAVSPNERYFRW